MSAATNAFGSSSGSEDTSVDVLVGSSSSQASLGRPSAFVCQRCLRLLDMYPLYSELSNVDVDLGFENDLIKVLERGEPVKHSQAFNVPLDPNGRSPGPSPSDSKLSSTLANYNLSGSATVAARSSTSSPTATGRKKRGEPGISKTFSSLTNFFKSSSTTNSGAPSPTPQQPTSASPSPSSPKGLPLAVPSRPSPEGSVSASISIPTEESQSIRDEDENDDDPMSNSRATSVTSSYAGTRSPQSINDVVHSLHTASCDDSLQDEESWVTRFTPPSLSASVSRAAMREKSFGPSLMPTTRRSKRIHGNNPSNADYVSRRNPTRDGIALASSTSALNVSSTIAAPQSITRSSLRKTSMLISQAMLETQIDFPLCHECSMDVLNELDDEDYDLEVQIEDYAAQLDWLNHDYFTHTDFADDVLDMEAELQECTNSIETLTSDIELLGDEAELWRNRGTELLMAKSEYWRQFEFHAADREAMLENTISAHNRLTHAKNWLEIMRSSHVLHDSFPISTDLHLATIGGLCLGRLASQPTDWPEISAALGLTVHLLHELCSNAGFSPPKYRLILEGSFSGMQKITSTGPLPTSSSNPRATESGSPAMDSVVRASAPPSTTSATTTGSIYPLHADGDISIVRLMHFKSLNDGLAALSECVYELSLHLARMHPAFSLPFPIAKDLVAGVSVKRAWNSSGATWSGAMRSLLADLKYSLAFMAKLGLCV